jgi:hypothetical protein
MTGDPASREQGFADVFVPPSPPRPYCSLCERPVERLEWCSNMDELTILAECHGERVLRRIELWRLNSIRDYEAAVLHPFFVESAA